MNPHAAFSASIQSLLASAWRNRYLIQQMIKHEVIGRYKGSVMGVMWSLIHPLFLLAIYTFVFSVVFKARWSVDMHESKSQFSILLFVAMIIHSLFAETLTKAPTLILNNVSYVKKIVFPLEILPIVSIGTALFHALISLLVLITFFVVMNGCLHWTILFFPIIILPLIILTLGFAWLLASLGVFVRDVAQPIGMLMTVLLFASPVFYPVSALPAYIQPWILLNPLTFIIEQSREVVVFGNYPNWMGLATYYFLSGVIAWLGYIWFQKTRKGFANVL
jgi:lipopolysaccharide transport system permease protein